MTQVAGMVGERVICNGYPGTITEVYVKPHALGRGMVVVRLERGSACVSVSDLQPA